MKLINKLTIWYFIITTMTLSIGGYIVFRSVLNEVDGEAISKLHSWVMLAARQLENGTPVDSLTIHPNVIVEELDINAPLVKYFKTDSIGVFPPRRYGPDRQLTISQSFKIRDKHYLITSQYFIAEPDEIEQGVRKSLYVIFLILLAIFVLISLLISGKILSPFNKSLEAIRTFNLKKQKPILSSHTSTKEFRVLNEFLGKMTKKAVDDYRTLKEFSENASHEIQTPLAVINGKLEFLMETDINQEQASHIQIIQNAVKRLSTINKSLLVLTKLDNQEYVPERINVSKALNDNLNGIRELISMRSLSLNEEIKDDVHVSIHPYLADLMFNNLISNAIKHNIPNGKILIKLTDKYFEIQNTGEKPDTLPEELFKRFKKGSQSSDTTGLGLSIVKQICDLNAMDIRYSFSENMHSIKIQFVQAS